MENSLTSQPSQLSPERWPRNTFPLGYTILTAIGCVVVLFAALFFFFFLSTKLVVHLDFRAVDPKHLTPSQTGIFLILQDLSYLPAIALLFYAVPRLAKRTLGELGIGRLRWSDLRNGVAGAALTWLAVALASVVLDGVTHQTHHQQELSMFEDLRGLPAIICGVTAVCIAPFCEEMIFRFFLLNALLRYMPVTIAVFLNGVLFGLAHGQLDVAPILAVCGIALATIYYRTGSLWANIIAHACFNGITTIALLVFHVGG